MTAQSHLQIAARLIDAVTAGNVDHLRDIYAPDAVIWHNNDGITQSVDENLAVLRWVVKNITNLRYEDIRRHATPTGFVEQHVLRGTLPNGSALSLPACIVCTVKDGRITRLDEYFDSAQLAPLLTGSQQT